MQTNRGASLFVYGVWALMLLAALIYVRKYARNVPFMCDDWNVMVPVTAGEQPIDTAWLWRPYGEHHIPLPKLVYLALYKLANNDLRGISYFSILVLGIIALALIRGAKSLRGRITYSDALFAFLLLHWGHAFNFEPFQVVFVLSAAFISILLLVIARRGADLTFAAALLVGGSLALFPLCGAVGVPFVPPLGLWLGYSSIRTWCTPVGYHSWKAFVILSLVVIALAVTGLYFIGYQPGPAPPSPGLAVSLSVALQFLTMTFGTAAGEFWPYSVPVVGLVLLPGVGFTALFLRRANANERQRLAGLLLLMLAFAFLALAVGLGRAGFDPHYALSASRYSLIGSLLLCCIYVAWIIYAPPAVSYCGQMILFTVAASALSLNDYEGREWGIGWTKTVAAVQEDLLAGMPALKLAQRYAESSAVRLKENVFLARLRTLRNSGMEPWRHLKEGPPVRAVAFSATPSNSFDMTWEGGTGHGTGHNPDMFFVLPKPRFLCGIRLQYAYSNVENTKDDPHKKPAAFHLSWQNCDRDSADKVNRFDAFLQKSSEMSSLTVWIYATIKQFRIQPDEQPCDFHIEDIRLLVPADEPHGRADLP